jgi:predicted NodU family carbamoyl transferase
MHILGISAYYHDAAACLMRDGEIVAAAQEEQYTRKKHDSAFPVQAIGYCLAEAGIDARQVDHIVFYDKPFLKFERLFASWRSATPCCANPTSPKAWPPITRPSMNSTRKMIHRRRTARTDCRAAT